MEKPGKSSLWKCWQGRAGLAVGTHSRQPSRGCLPGREMGWGWEPQHCEICQQENPSRAPPPPTPQFLLSLIRAQVAERRHHRRAGGYVLFRASLGT